MPAKGDIKTWPDGSQSTWDGEKWVLDMGMITGGNIQPALDAINGTADEPSMSNGIPGLLGMFGLSVNWSLQDVPWWIWAGLAAGAVLLLSSRRGR